MDLIKPDIKDKLTNVIGSNPNESYSNLMNIISPLINKYFKVKYVRYDKYKHKKSNWITSGILKSISFKDKLYIKLRCTPFSSNQYQILQTNFKTYNNILRKTLREAKRQYYHNQFAKFKSNIKETWDTINE